MKGRKQKLKSGDEWDVVSTEARKLLCFTQKPGACKQIKKILNKRARQEDKRLEQEEEGAYNVAV